MTVEINTFVERKVDGGKNNVVFYKVEIGFMKNNKRWFLEKRYSEFDQLNNVLKEMFPNIAALPGKTFFKLSDEKQIEERRKVLS